MFIDIHVHAESVPGHPGWDGKNTLASPEQLLEIYDAVGIEQGCVQPLGSPEIWAGPLSNQEMLAIRDAYPDRFIPFCSVDPRAMTNSADAPLDSVLAFWKDKGCRGVGEVIANLPFLDPLVQNLFKHVESVGLPLTFHVAARIGGTYGLYDEPGLPGLERSLRLFPKLNFLGHSHGFWAEIGRLRTPADRYIYPDYPIDEEGVVPELLRRYPNMLGDLSAGSGYNALARDPDYAVGFLNEFQDKLYFGTDICRPNQPTPLVDFLIDLRDKGKITDEVFRKIARENAVRLLGL